MGIQIGTVIRVGTWYSAVSRPEASGDGKRERKKWSSQKRQERRRGDWLGGGDGTRWRVKDGQSGVEQGLRKPGPIRRRDDE